MKGPLHTIECRLTCLSQDGSSLVGNGTGSNVIRVEDDDDNLEGVSSSTIDVDCNVKQGEG